MSKKYKYKKMNEMEEILVNLEMPGKLRNRRSVLTMLAFARLGEKSRWKDVQESYLRIHDIIEFINEYYPDKGGTDPKRGGYKENSRESIRDDTVTPLCDIAILEHNREKSQSEKNAYRLTNQFAILLKAWGTEEWEDELEFYRHTHQSYKERYSQIKKIEKGMDVKFGGEEFHLERSSHNKLQKEILEVFAPNFVSGSILLYLGDTKKRELKKDEEMLSKLKVRVLEHFMMPDIILFQEERRWLIFIEAYTSTGEFTVERVDKIKEYCAECPKDIELIFITAFSTMKKCKEKLLSIAWDTEIWVAEEPTHMIHKNGDKFIGAHEKK